MIEKEIKLLLSEDEFDRLLKQFEWDSKFLQVNYYYDTDSLQLHNNGITCRVREKGFRPTLQIKEKNTSKSLVYSEKNEKEYDIYSIPDMIEINKYLTDVNVSQVKLLGCLKTQRFQKRINQNTLLCLDKNYYFKQIDYELEIEFEDDSYFAERLLNKITRADNKTSVPAGKYTRFITELKRQPPNI